MAWMKGMKHTTHMQKISHEKKNDNEGGENTTKRVDVKDEQVASACDQGL